MSKIDFKKGDLVEFSLGEKSSKLGVVLDSVIEHDEGLTVFYYVLIKGQSLKIERAKLTHVNDDVK